MWTRELEDKGLLWACEILTMERLRHGFHPSRYGGADLVVIDEAHRLRGGGTWFHKAIDLVRAGERPEDKRVLLLTATPVNTGMADLVNLLRVLTKNQRSVWAPEIADFERHLKRVERGEADPFPVLDRSLVRRSRSDILRAQEEARAAGQHVEAVRLPERRLAHVDHGYGGREDLFETFAGGLRRSRSRPMTSSASAATRAGTQRSRSSSIPTAGYWTRRIATSRFALARWPPSARLAC